MLEERPLGTEEETTCESLPESLPFFGVLRRSAPLTCKAAGMCWTGASFWASSFLGS